VVEKFTTQSPMKPTLQLPAALLLPWRSQRSLGWSLPHTVAPAEMPWETPPEWSLDNTAGDTVWEDCTKPPKGTREEWKTEEKHNPSWRTGLERLFYSLELSCVALGLCHIKSCFWMYLGLKDAGECLRLDSKAFKNGS